MKTSVTVIISAALIAAAIFFSRQSEPQTDSEAQGSTTKTSIDDDAAFSAATDRARETVRMLDDIYKGGIVTITDKYVTEDSEIPAGTAFKQIFAIAKEKGWHEARLLDVTGDPFSTSNVAVDDFEKRGVKKMADGVEYYEEIEEVGDEKYLRAMTPIPVALEKCTWCHSNYEDLPKDQAIGAMGYRLKIAK